MMRQFAKDTAKSLASIHDQLARYAELIETNINRLARHDRRLARMEGHTVSEEGGEDGETAARTGAEGELLPSQHCPSEGSGVAPARPVPHLHAATAAGELMEELLAESPPVLVAAYLGTTRLIDNLHLNLN